jgi:tetratricopeptide (TPR) repeat protein
MVGVGVVLLAAHALTVVRPATRSARVLASLQEALARPPSADRPKAVLEAVDSYTARYCGDAVSRTALRALLQLARSPEIAPDQRLNWLMLVRTRAAAACVANSCETGNYILLATADEELARHYAQTGDADSAAHYRRSAAEDWDQAVQRYPTNPHTRISAGKAWLETWRYQRAPDAAERARAHFQAALRIDDSRPAEEVVRLRPRERAEIVSELRALDEFTPPATEPLSR